MIEALKLLRKNIIKRRKYIYDLTPDPKDPEALDYRVASLNDMANVMDTTIKELEVRESLKPEPVQDQ